MELDLEHMNNISCDFGGGLMLRSGIINRDLSGIESGVIKNYFEFIRIHQESSQESSHIAH